MAERHPYVLLRCDACGRLIDSALGRERADQAAGSTHFSAPEDDASAPATGLLVFVRDGEVRYEEPPLCSHCSVAIGVTALVRWAEEEEEG